MISSDPKHRLERTRSWIGHTLVAFTMVLAVAYAASDVKVSYSDGHVTAPQEFAGTGYHGLELTNLSSQPVVFTLVRLKQGVGLGEFQKTNDALQTAVESEGDAVKYEQQFLDQATGYGGTTVAPTASIVMYADLEPGDYAVTAGEVSETGDAGKVSYGSFTVTESGPKAKPPTAEHDLKMRDFAFDMPDQISAGTSLWHVTNTGEQPHIATFFKLAPDKTKDDLKSFLSEEGSAPTGQPPFDPNAMVDVEVLTPGAEVYLPLDFSSGNWVAVCFVQDLKNPQVRHFMEGMIDAFTVN